MSNSCLEAINSKQIIDCSVRVTAQTEISGIELHELPEGKHPLRELINGYGFDKEPAEHHFNNSDAWPLNYLVIQMKVDPSISRRVLLVLTTELSHLLKVAIQLQYGTENFLYYGKPDVPDNCLAYLDGKGQQIWSYHQSIEHTFPAELLKFDNVQFKNLCEELASNWAGNIWPLHRFLRAIPYRCRLDCDSLLDLVFSLEAMFQQSANSQFIRTYCGCFEKDVDDARIVKEILKEAFGVRNRIVHAGKWFDADSEISVGMKKMKLPKLILAVKTIVTKAMIQGLKNAPAYSGKPTLNEETLTKMFFESK